MAAMIADTSPVTRAPVSLRRLHAQADAAFRVDPNEVTWRTLCAAVGACIAHDDAMRGRAAA
jgi:hypothetical protein